MSARLTSQTMEEKAQDYWVMSRQWRGDRRFGGVTVGDLLKNLADLAGDLNQLGWNICEHRTAELLNQVINNKRCRKSKARNNIINLNERKAFQAQALLQEMRGDPQSLIGLQVTMQIKVG